MNEEAVKTETTEEEPRERRPLTEQEIDRLAWDAAELPEGLGPGEALYFLCMRPVYEMARRMDLPPEQGAREKARVQRLCRAYRLDQEYVIGTARRDMRTEAARTAYRKAAKAGDTDAMLAAADRLVELLENVPVKHREAGQR